MANLNAWQKITRVIPGKPFGNGSDGAYSSATIPTMTYVSMSTRASGNNDITVSASTLANNDVVMIIQIRGTGEGQWEINQVASGGGTTSITLKENLQYSYTDSGASQVQVVVIKQYTNVTVQAGTWTLSGWDGNTGGILAFAATGTTTVTGTIDAEEAGFVGGSAYNLGGSTGFCGEGTAAASSQKRTQNGSGGGGGEDASPDRAAGGGGHANAGSNGQGSPTYGEGGSAVGSSDLTDMVFGGAGGGKWGLNESGTEGGNSGGIVYIFSKKITITGTIKNDGGDAADQSQEEGGSGGGSGGSVLIGCQTGTLGTDKITVALGNGASGTSNNGGNGSVGRIAVHHSGTVSGSTTPSFDDETDATLVQTESMAVMNFL